MNYTDGVNERDARKGCPPGIAGDRQGPRHRKAMGSDESTERSRDRWLCSVFVRACREEGTTRQKARQKKKITNKTPQRLRRTCGPKRADGGGTGRSKRANEGPRGARGPGRGNPHRSKGEHTTQAEGGSKGAAKARHANRTEEVSGSGGPAPGSCRRPKKKRETKRDAGKRGRDRKGRVARATQWPQGNRTAWEAAREKGAGAGRERPVLGARNGPRMDEDPVDPRHRVAGSPEGYKHGTRDEMGPHNSEAGQGFHGTLGNGP